MIVISTINPHPNTLTIHNFGLERISSEAHFGPAIRDHYILHYVLKGSGFFNGKPVSKGQGFSIKKNSLHEYHSSNTDPWEYFFVQFSGDDDYLKKCFADTGISLDDSIFDIDFFPALLEFIEKITHDSPSFISSAKALSHFYSLVSLHETAMQKSINIPVSALHIKNAILFMRNNYHRNIKITDIAHHVYVDDRYLYNLFIKKLGISPKAYLNELRISRACCLLCNSTLTISNISNSVGYDDMEGYPHSSLHRNDFAVK